MTHHVCLSYVQHTPDIQYNVPMLPRGVIQRDAEGNEIRRPGASAVERIRAIRPGSAARPGPEGDAAAPRDFPGFSASSSAGAPVRH